MKAIHFVWEVTTRVSDRSVESSLAHFFNRKEGNIVSLCGQIKRAPSKFQTQMADGERHCQRCDRINNKNLADNKKKVTVTAAVVAQREARNRRLAENPLEI